MKLKTIYRCQQCGQASPKWAGQCPGCGGWNSLIEEAEQVLSKAAAAARGLTDFSEAPVKLSEARAMKAEHAPTGISELDRALGGGLVAGQVVLLAGPPWPPAPTPAKKSFMSPARNPCPRWVPAPSAWAPGPTMST